MKLSVESIQAFGWAGRVVSPYRDRLNSQDSELQTKNHLDLYRSSASRMRKLTAAAIPSMMKSASRVFGSRASAAFPRQPTAGLSFHLFHRRLIWPDSYILFRLNKRHRSECQKDLLEVHDGRILPAFCPNNDKIGVKACRGLTDFATVVVERLVETVIQLLESDKNMGCKHKAIILINHLLYALLLPADVLPHLLHKLGHHRVS